MSKLQRGLGMVAYTWNLSYLGGEDGEDHSLRPAQAKVSNAPSQPINYKEG
jgi:hypothetical protein